MSMRLRPAGVRSPTISLARARCRVFTLSAARPLAPRLRSTAAFVASPHSSIRSFATTTDAPTSKPSPSKTPEYYGSVIKNPPTAPAPSGIAPLPHRTVILVAGDMTTAFLNGLTTNKIPSWNKQEEDGVRGIYTGILNPQGRVLFDAFVYPTAVKSKDGEYVRGCYLEVDEMVRKQFMILLKRYKLRTKLTLEYARDMGVFAAWGPGFNDPERPGRHLPKVGGPVVMRDERIPGFGTRFVAPVTPEFKESPAWMGPAELTEWTLPPSLQEMEDVAALPRVSTAHYHIRRFLKGLPEGSQEMQLGEALPLECNMDLMKGIDFQKGCYVGQELTIRTKHTGVVRKRILPIRLYNLDAGSVPTTLELVKEEGGFWAAHDMAAQKNHNVSGIRPASTLLDKPPDSKPVTESGEPQELTKEEQRELARQVREHRRKNRAVGRFLNGTGNVGLALCRLDAMTDVNVPGAAEDQAELGRSYGADEQFGVTWKKSNDSEDEVGVGVKAFIPAWHRERMLAEESARAEEKRRRRAAIDAGNRIAEQAEYEGNTRTSHERRGVRKAVKDAMNATLAGKKVHEPPSVWDTIDETPEERKERQLREQQERDDELGADDDYADVDFGKDKGWTHRFTKAQRKELRRNMKRRLELAELRRVQRGQKPRERGGGHAVRVVKGDEERPRAENWGVRKDNERPRRKWGVEEDEKKSESSR